MNQMIKYLLINNRFHLLNNLKKRNLLNNNHQETNKRNRKFKKIWVLSSQKNLLKIFNLIKAFSKLTLQWVACPIVRVITILIGTWIQTVKALISLIHNSNLSVLTRLPHHLIFNLKLLTRFYSKKNRKKNYLSLKKI